MKPLAAAVFLTSLAAASAGEDAPKPVTLAQALKLGPEKLTDLTGGSEVGQDIACQLYASAKRLQTENRLAAKDMRLVAELDSARRTIGDCIDGFCNLAYGLNGGGTMYSHAEARNDVALEDFLAEFSNHPTAPGKGDPATTRRLEELAKHVSSLEIPADIKADAGAEMVAAFAKFRAETLESLNTVKVICSESEPTRAKALGKFVVSQAKWIDFPAAEPKDGK